MDERAYLEEKLPGFYSRLRRFRDNRTMEIHGWLRDCVYEVLFDDSYPMWSNNRSVAATALTQTVRDLVNDAADQGVDVTQLMRDNSAIEFGLQALHDPRLQQHLDEASTRWVDNTIRTQQRLDDAFREAG